MARLLGTSFSEQAKLVGFSRVTVVSIYGKWLKDVLDVHVLSKNLGSEACPLCKAGQAVAEADRTSECIAGAGTSVSENTVQRTLFNIPYPISTRWNTSWTLNPRPSFRYLVQCGTRYLRKSANDLSNICHSESLLYCVPWWAKRLLSRFSMF